MSLLIQPHESPGRISVPPLWFGPDVFHAFGVSRGPDGGLLWANVRQLRDTLATSNSGDKRWRSFKLAELESVIDLAQRTPRVRLLGGDLQGDLSLFVYLHTPAPRWPQQQRLRITDHVILHVGYHSDWLVEPPPPAAPVGVMEPMDLFLPNASPQPRSALCLGALPAGVPVVELVQLAYLAVSAQTMMPDETEGVMNLTAAEWFREHPQFVPLTRTGLLEPWSESDLELDDAVFEPGGGAL